MLIFQEKEKTENNTNNFGFHYTYNFDSSPEKDFYINLLNMINEKPEDVEYIFQSALDRLE